jgi:N-acetylglucosaminyldiphosphoundecaprenol N-acetyl-beta-D-mannosaminyltransferase
MLDFSAIADRKGQSRELGPVFVNTPDWGKLLADLEARLVRAQGFSLATLNLDHLVKLRRDKVFRTAYAAQTYVTADGKPVVWICRVAAQRVSLIPGSELVEPVVAIAEQYNVPVALVGSTKASLQGAADVLTARYPEISIVAQIAPLMGFDPSGPEADAIIAELSVSGARLCLLALGAPKQEVFAVRALAALPRVGFISVGAGIDFLSGTQSRAPLWVRSLALEWLWRLVKDPRRLFARYVRCFAILPLAVRLALRARRDGKWSECHNET